MAINFTTNKFTAIGAGVSISQISDFYKGQEIRRNVKFSEFYRNTTSDEPVVPDATENVNIPTASQKNLKFGDFPDTIKSCTVTHPSTDVLKNVNYHQYFNNNLSKNVPKTLDVQGEAYSNSLTQYAASVIGGATNSSGTYVQGKIHNLNMKIRGKIYGAAGNRDQDGGDALWIQGNTQNRNVNIEIESGGAVYAGGGGGNPAPAGGGSVSNNCNWHYTYTYRRNDPVPAVAHTNSGYWQPNPPHTGGNGRGCSRLRGGGIRGWSGTRGSSSNCSAPAGSSWIPGYTWYQPQPNRSTTEYGATRYRQQISANNGTGGSGGVGEGLAQPWTAGQPTSGKIQAKTNGNPGNPGNSSSCSSPYSGDDAVGSDGKKGNDGGNFGQGTANTSAGYALKYFGPITTKPGFGNNTLAKGKIDQV